GDPPRRATLTVWDATTAERLDSREVESPGLIMYGAFSPDLRWYFFGERPLPIGGEPGLRLELPKSWRPKQAEVSPDGRLVTQVVEQPVKDGKGDNVGIDAQVVAHEVATGSRVLLLPTGPSGPIAFTPDGRGL